MSSTKLKHLLTNLSLSLKSRVWNRMFGFEACEVFEIKELTFVNDCFKHKHNSLSRFFFGKEIGHYRRTLISNSGSHYHLPISPSGITFFLQK